MSIRTSAQPFMRCTNPKCGRMGTLWDVENEAFCCPDCEMDESGLELVDPREAVVGRHFLRKRNNRRVRVMEYLGGNTVRVMDSFRITTTMSLLELHPRPVEPQP